MTPETCEATETARIASTVPGAVTSKGTGRSSALATVTGTAGGAGRGRSLHAAKASSATVDRANRELGVIVVIRVLEERRKLNAPVGAASNYAQVPGNAVGEKGWKGW